MAFAIRYHRWILQVFEPFLGKHVVEVGAGTGSFSALLLERPLKSLHLVEPSSAMHKILSATMATRSGATQIKTYEAYFSEVADTIKAIEPPDSIVYVNVLEHVPDDEAELRVIFQTLRTGGRLFAFVPALQCLFSRMDRELGHHRRYSLDELRAKCLGAGFKILQANYFDVLGIVPWWVKYRLLGSNKMEPGAVSLYDKCVVPISRTIETLVSPPVGKNLILIGEKT